MKARIALASSGSDCATNAIELDLYLSNRFLILVSIIKLHSPVFVEINRLSGLGVRLAFYGNPCGTINFKAISWNYHRSTSRYFLAQLVVSADQKVPA